MRTIALTKISNRNEVYYGRYSVVSIEIWISIWQLVPVLFRVSRSPGLWNQLFLQVVRQNTQRKCDCLSYLSGCDHKICKRVVPTIEKVGDELWKLYQNPMRSYWNKTNRRLRISRKISTVNSKAFQGSLVYFKKSENFCEPNISLGIPGTLGRECNRTSNNEDGCAAMCCGRAYKTIVLQENVKCNCRMVWPCCHIKCDVCKLTRVVGICR
jgi:hypothetical protein